MLYLLPPPASLLHYGDDDSSHDYFLAEYKHEQEWERRQYQGGHDQMVAVALLELLDVDHNRPHSRILTDDERPHESSVRHCEGAESFDRHNRFDER